MPLFSIKSDRLERVKEVPFKSERKEIQHTTESRLKDVFGFEYVTDLNGAKLFRKRK